MRKICGHFLNGDNTKKYFSIESGRFFSAAHWHRFTSFKVVKVLYVLMWLKELLCLLLACNQYYLKKYSQNKTLNKLNNWSEFAHKIFNSLKSESKIPEAYDVTGSKTSTSDCNRSGLPLKYCHNYIKEIISFNKKVFYCGTDSASRSCVNLYDRSEKYRLDDIVGFTPTTETVAKKINEKRIISAGPRSIDESRFGIYIAEIDGNRFSRIRSVVYIRV